MKYIKELLWFLADMLKSRRLIFELVKKDFQTRYLGSYLGVLWAFVQPTITMLVFWFVFEVGFKSKPIDNFPYILWLMSGMIPWFFFADALSSATNSIVESSYLIKKVVFRVSILPTIKIFSALVIHIFFILFLFTMFLLYGYEMNIYYFQVFYYLFASFALVFALSWITSSLLVFSRDVGQFVNVVLQFGFWLTPIFWSLDMVPDRYRSILELNPTYYIVEGYRNSFIYHKWFWEDITLTLNFWLVTISLLIIGAILFKRLKPHFADVL